MELLCHMDVRGVVGVSAVGITDLKDRASRNEQGSGDWRLQIGNLMVREFQGPDPFIRASRPDVCRQTRTRRPDNIVGELEIPDDQCPWSLISLLNAGDRDELDGDRRR